MSISPHQGYKKEEIVALMFFCIEQFILDKNSCSILMKSVFISVHILFCELYYSQERWCQGTDFLLAAEKTILGLYKSVPVISFLLV